MTRLSTTEVADAAIAAGRARQGFQMARFGHCEGRIMGSEIIFPRHEVDKSLRLQLGDDGLSDDSLREISEGVRSAYVATDIAGVTSLAAPRPGQEKFDELLMAIPQAVKMLGISEADKRYCSTDIHLQLLVSGEIDRVIAAFDDILVINCRNVKGGLAKRYQLRFSQYVIPQEYRTTGIDDDILGSRHYPDVYGALCAKLPTAIKPGQLVLIGAGFLGKIYGRIVRESGGVALDLGSVFDVWAGVASRSFISPDSKFAPYRLDKSSDEAPPEEVVDKLPHVQSRKEWVVDSRNRPPIWLASDQVGSAIITPQSNDHLARLRGKEIFTHSSIGGRNFVEFSEFPDTPALAVCSTLALVHQDAQPTEFRLRLISKAGIVADFSDVRNGDTATHWLGFLPPNFVVALLRVWAQPADGKSTGHGWAFFRNLRLY